MDEDPPREPADAAAVTTVERASDTELVVTRTVAGPARLVFEAWSDRALFQRWWVPRSFAGTLIAFEADIRTGGTYRLVMGIRPRSSRWRSSAGIST